MPTGTSRPVVAIKVNLSKTARAIFEYSYKGAVFQGKAQKQSLLLLRKNALHHGSHFHKRSLWLSQVRAEEF